MKAQTDAVESRNFLRDVHEIVRDLQRPNLAIFWTDFLITIAVAYTAFALYQSAADFSILQTVTFLISGIAIYRAVVFVHEIAHRPPGAFVGFTFCWNLLCGIPAMMPSFLYGDHKSHHSNQSYGTRSDAKYVFVTAGRHRGIVFLLLSFVYPLLGVLRFLFLTPVAFIFRGADRFIWTCTSSLYMMNPDYRREYDSSAHDRARWLQELAWFVWGWSIVWLMWTGRASVHALIKTYLVFLFWMGLNQFRTLTAHRYASDGERQDSIRQLLDSNTFGGGRLLPDLWAPLGLRYHALHHIMPSLPYHSMAEAHRRLMRRLPAGSPYHQTLQTGMWSSLRNAL